MGDGPRTHFRIQLSARDPRTGPSVNSGNDGGTQHYAQSIALIQRAAANIGEHAATDKKGGFATEDLSDLRPTRMHLTFEMSLSTSMQ